ncbi:MAG TPA: NAD-dependent epimerase/dehydratase family protein [Myxococcota bacterium]|nr:NAD-dependent epimerase/dehydratase family protein [Myxococcota bacterium]
MRVLIAGCGYVGSVLAARLAAAGHEVTGLRRRPDGLPAGVVPFAADLADPRSLRALSGPFDAVVYAAAPDRRDEAAYRAVYVDGVAHVAAAAAGARFVLVSSTSVYGQDDGSEVDERSPTEPRELSGRLVLEGERRAREGAAGAVALRCGGIYGPGRTRLLDAARAGRLAASSTSVRWTNRIHRDDAAGALAHLLALPAPEPVYVGVDAEPAREDEVYRWLAARVGRPLPDARRADGERPVRGKRCSSRRLLASGYRLSFPTFREGYGALVDAGR